MYIYPPLLGDGSGHHVGLPLDGPTFQVIIAFTSILQKQPTAKTALLLAHAADTFIGDISSLPLLWRRYLVVLAIWHTAKMAAVPYGGGFWDCATTDTHFHNQLANYFRNVVVE